MIFFQNISTMSGESIGSDSRAIPVYTSENDQIEIPENFRKMRQIVQKPKHGRWEQRAVVERIQT